ncbi:substrate-binding domain-containing protein [Geomesophilobacter sediminis]|uniref:Substrate-binding domain-containing protein n=1 Tax=Geomesophilobacter sediminis TaxID=2798584 RepID=A0A8J7IMQ0_9BACT|nr:substrate-binding domain-containing protein [Geomesophilobacter sediminis]MBJ6724128.1 substrate-binding domain-containing protein [Geomesophilobacter sediminis]
MIHRFLLLVAAWLLTLPMIAAAEPVMVSGCSVSNLGYLNDLARFYEKKTGQKILVRGGGSIVGLSELGADRVDIAASCQRKIPPNKDFRVIPVAWDALVFIVNKRNPVNEITPQQVRDIYDGRVTSWKQIGGDNLRLISYVTTPEGLGGIGEALEKYLLNGKRPQIVANSSLQASSVAVWEQLVERHPEGFASTGYGSARKRNVKLLAFNGVAPTKATIISGKYPLKRYLYLVLPKDAKPEARRFVDWVLSKEGQTHISALGLPALAEIR